MGLLDLLGEELVGELSVSTRYAHPHLVALRGGEELVGELSVSTGSAVRAIRPAQAAPASMQPLNVDHRGMEGAPAGSVDSISQVADPGQRCALTVNRAFVVTSAVGSTPTSAPADSCTSSAFPIGASLETVRRWRLDTRVSLKSTQPTKGTLAADVEPFVRQIADRPQLVAERRQQLDWWVARLGHRRRHTITTADVRTALAELRQTHAASTCNHYRQALLSLYRALDGRHAPNPVRDVEPFANPAPEVRGLSYEMIGRILAAMSDRGSARG